MEVTAAGHLLVEEKDRKPKPKTRYERRQRREKTGTEATAAGRRLGKEKESSMVPRTPRNYEVQTSTVIFVDGGGETKQIREGYPVAELVEVRLKTKEKKCGRISGTIKANFADVCDMILFDRSHHNPQIVHRGDSLELTGPLFVIDATCVVVILIDLKDDQDEIAQIDLDWDFLYGDSYNVVYTPKIYQRKSFVRISFVPYESAVEAVIGITFEPRCPIKICGTVRSYNNMFCDLKSTLFSKKKSLGEHFSMEHEGGQQQLPLLRSVIAVPIHSQSIEQREDFVDGCLLLDFNLTNIHDDGTIAEGVLKFPLQNLGDYICEICSKYGKMQVKVSFDL